MRLEELAALVPGARLEGDPATDVARVVHDSRQVRPGDLFVALRGTKVDGHRFVQDAIDAGAAAAVVERPLPLPRTPPLVIAPDAREAMGLAAHALAGFPTRTLRAVGVTGTNGKTTTTYLLRTVFEVAGWKTGLIGTIEYAVGERRIRSHMTTPDALELADYFAQMVEDGVHAAVMEVSSHALDQRRTAGIEFDVGVHTNVTPEHLDYHKDMPSYLAAKARLFAGLGPEATAVLNADDAACELFASGTRASVLRYGLDRPAEVTAEGLAVDVGGSRFTLVAPSGRTTVRLNLLGRHNVLNALATAAAAEAMGLGLDVMAAGLEAADTVRGRLDPVPSGAPFTVLVDYAHTPDAVKHALRAVREMCGGRVILVMGCGGERDRTKRPMMAAEAEAAADRVIVTNDNPRGEAPEAIAEEILAGFTRPQAVEVELDRRAAIGLALDAAGPGDLVLIAGKGHETYQETAQGTVPFDDREVARDLLAARGWGEAG